MERTISTNWAQALRESVGLMNWDGDCGGWYDHPDGMYDEEFYEESDREESQRHGGTMLYDTDLDSYDDTNSDSSDSRASLLDVVCPSS